MNYIFAHTRFGFCWWDIPALLILVGLICFFSWKKRQLVREKEELEEQLSDLYAANSMNAPTGE